MDASTPEDGGGFFVGGGSHFSFFVVLLFLEGCALDSKAELGASERLLLVTVASLSLDGSLLSLGC